MKNIFIKILFRESSLKCVLRSGVLNQIPHKSTLPLALLSGVDCLMYWISHKLNFRPLERRKSAKDWREGSERGAASGWIGQCASEGRRVARLHAQSEPLPGPDWPTVSEGILGDF